jgi:membrane associated rhomboid family serine protease
MGESERYLEYKHHRKKRRYALGSDNNAIVALFAVNIFFFLLLLLIQVGYYFGRQSSEVFNQQIVEWFSLPSSGKLLLHRPWTLLSYMFCDTGSGLMRMIGNMLWLWSFGYILQITAGNDKVVPVYLYGGLLGGIFFIVSNSFALSETTLSHSQFIGANASVMAVATATTTLYPKHRIFTHIRNGFPLWILFLLYATFDFLGTSASAVHFFTHLGGALAGFLFAVFLKRGFDGSVWMNTAYNRFIHIFTPGSKITNKSTKDEIFYVVGKNKPYTKQSRITQQRIDDLLDKISELGYDNLSDEEKTFLKKASEQDNY